MNGGNREERTQTKKFPCSKVPENLIFSTSLTFYYRHFTKPKTPGVEKKNSIFIKDKPCFSKNIKSCLQIDKAV